MTKSLLVVFATALVAFAVLQGDARQAEARPSEPDNTATKKWTFEVVR